jgi:hypothetical protein
MPKYLLWALMFLRFNKAENVMGDMAGRLLV